MNIEIKFCVLCILVPGTLEVFSGLFLLYEYKNYIKIKNYELESTRKSSSFNSL